MTERKPYVWPLPDPESRVENQPRPALGQRDSVGSSRHENSEACLDSGRGTSLLSGRKPSEDMGSRYLHQEPRGSRLGKKVSGASLYHYQKADAGKPSLCKEPKDHPPEDRGRGGNKMDNSRGPSGFRASIEHAGTAGMCGLMSSNWREIREHSATSSDLSSREARGPKRGKDIYPGAVGSQVSELQRARGGNRRLRRGDGRRGYSSQRHQDHSSQDPRYQQIAPQHPQPQPPENLQFLYHQSLHYEWLRTSFANPLVYEPRYYSFKYYACQYYDMVQQFGFQHYGVWPNLYHPSQVPPPSPSHEAPRYYQGSLQNLSDNLSEQPSHVSYSPNQAFQSQTPQQSSSNPSYLDDRIPQESIPHDNTQHQGPSQSRSDEAVAPYHDQETLHEDSKNVIGGRGEQHQLPNGSKCRRRRTGNGWKQRRKVARRTWNDETEIAIKLILNTAPQAKPAALFPPGRDIHARNEESGEYVFRLPSQTDAGFSGQVRLNMVSLPPPFFSFEI